MAQGVAKFDKDINSWLNSIGEGVVKFNEKGTPTLDVINDFIKELRHNLEQDKHIGSGNLYQQLGEGWDIKIMGKRAKIQLILPEYYEATDTGRKPSSKKGSGSVFKNLTGGRGWIAQKRIKLPTTYTAKWKLKDGTIKTKQRKYKNKTQANKALGFMISRKIHKFGFKGTGWFSRAAFDFIRDINIAIEKEFGAGEINITINGHNAK